MLYITLSETREELDARRQVARLGPRAASPIRELLPQEDALESDEQYTMFHPSEVELAATTKSILEDVHKLKPTRVVFDSLSELRLVAGNPLRYRRQILALKQFFAGRSCTVILLDDMTADRSRPAGAEHRARRDPAASISAPSTAPSGAGCASSSIAAASSAAAITTT